MNAITSSLATGTPPRVSAFAAVGGGAIEPAARAPAAGMPPPVRPACPPLPDVGGTDPPALPPALPPAGAPAAPAADGCVMGAEVPAALALPPLPAPAAAEGPGPKSLLGS